MRLSGYGEGEPSGPDTARRARREASFSGTGRDRPRPFAPRGGVLPRKEVIQPHLPVRLPCYDFVPITGPAFDRSPWGHGLRASPTFMT